MSWYSRSRTKRILHLSAASIRRTNHKSCLVSCLTTLFEYKVLIICHVSCRLTPTTYFDLTGSSLRTKIKIDRESLPSDVIQLIAISNEPGEAPVEFTVTVLDINDNDPQFPEATLHLNLPELGGPQSKVSCSSRWTCQVTFPVCLKILVS